MDDDLSQQFAFLVQQGEIDACIVYLEDDLKAIQATPYHTLLGRDFLHQTKELSAWLVDFCRRTVRTIELRAIYLEMNGFSINADKWLCNAFGYTTAGDMWELDWLADWQAESARFVLRGMEPVQNAFASLYGDIRQPRSVKLAEAIAEHLVTARFMQLGDAAHQQAKRSFPPLMVMPVLATAHDWDIVHRSE